MLEEIVQPLALWYQKNHRRLPWREQKNPYYIWISEIMLQQTKVEAVKPFFSRFIEALPTIAAVAECPEDKLLKLWEGLGYYNRVRNIQKAAVAVIEKYEGRLPQDYQQLMSLPGIGAYTAGAVASIAFDIPVPAVDGNVLRVTSRLLESEADVMKKSQQDKIRKLLLKIMPNEQPGDFNQALMELGATVCLPGALAKCTCCPLAKWCLSRQHNRVAELPIRARAKPRRAEQRTVLVIRDGDRVAIRKRSAKGLLAGLYELPNYSGHLTSEEVLAKMNDYQLTTLQIQPLAEAKHIFSHIEWRMSGYVIRVAELESGQDMDMLFVDVKDAEESYPMPAAFQAYAACLKLRLGQDKYLGGEYETVNDRGALL